MGGLRPHNASADARRHFPFHTCLTFTLLFVLGADDLVLLVHGAGDLHRGGHGCRKFLGVISCGSVSYFKFLWEFLLIGLLVTTHLHHYYDFHEHYWHH